MRTTATDKNGVARRGWFGAPVGRLFWKFFFFFWAAQLVTSIGVGVTIWALRPDPGERASLAERGPRAGRDGGSPFGPAASGDGRAFPPPGAFHRPPEAGQHPLPHLRGRPWRPLYLPLIAGGFVSLIFAALLAWYFARPIRVLRQAFEDVAGGRLEARVGDAMGRRRDELADLGSDFDRMADRLQALIDAQRRLLHDVSHELRSPLARLQAAVELMRQQPERAVELLARIERDSGRMDTLVGELLTLARLDAGAAGRTHAGVTAGEVVDLADLLAAIAEDAEFEVAGDDGPGARIDTDFSSPLPVRGDRELLHRAIENVVRNAVRHSGRAADAGGECAIALSARMASAQEGGRQIVVEVADHGPGVPEAELERIFEPFFRSGGNAPAGGYGLGLAITRRVVAAHGGTVSARNRSAGGLIVRIEMPAA